MRLGPPRSKPSSPRAMRSRRAGQVFSLIVTFACVLSALTCSSRASADPTQTSFYCDMQIDVSELSPTHLSFDSGHVQGRSLQGTLPSFGSTTLMGGGFELGVNVGKHLILPIVGGSYTTALGGYREREASFDGTIIHYRPWTTEMVTFSLGGLGYRSNVGRWTFSATALPGIAGISSGADAAYGLNTFELNPGKTLFYLSAEIAACRRLDPMERLCVVAAPNVYEGGFFQGGTIALRYEVGK